MCYCNPSIKTPNCGSVACTEAAKDASMRLFLHGKETPIPIINPISFETKLKTIAKLQSELDEHVWKVFHRYIEDNHINFSNPECWEAEEGHIYFSGQDGCRGSYEHKVLNIPIKCFIKGENQ